MQFGNTLLQDKVMVGFSAEQFGLSIPEMVKLYEALPLKEAVVGSGCAATPSASCGSTDVRHGEDEVGAVDARCLRAAVADGGNSTAMSSQQGPRAVYGHQRDNGRVRPGAVMTEKILIIAMTKRPNPLPFRRKWAILAVRVLCTDTGRQHRPVNGHPSRPISRGEPACCHRKKTN